MKVTSTSKNVMVRIRSPLKLLELQAEVQGYRLQLRGEVDPGSEEFWNREITNGFGAEIAVELEEEQRIYKEEEARVALAELYKAGKISPGDLELFSDVEVEISWSRRIHVLERIADRVPVWNKTPAYAPFEAKPHLRYLFAVYPSCRGKTLFRPKDRLFLTKAVLDKFFDLDMLSVDGIASGLMALHDANRGESLTIDILKRRWVTFWKPAANEVGSPMITMPGYDISEDVSVLYRPFSQPLGDIRSYFGEKIALYFAWLGMFTFYLTAPGLTGLVVEIAYLILNDADTSGSVNWLCVGYQVFMIVWFVVYESGWNAECEACALKWGTRDFEATEKDRPQVGALLATS